MQVYNHPETKPPTDPDAVVIVEYEAGSILVTKVSAVDWGWNSGRDNVIGYELVGDRYV